MTRRIIKQTNLQWDSRDTAKFSIKLYWKFVRISVWLLARNYSDIYPSFILLAQRIARLLDQSGRSFTVLYLKEAHRLTMKTVAGELVEQNESVRVAMRRGLPLIIPGNLRLLMEVKDTVVIKYVLTLLSVFRVIPAYPKLKLETITDPHRGLIKTLPEITLVIQELLRLVRGNSGLKYFQQVIRPFPVVNRNLLRLTSAGPNHKFQLVGYPLDALAFKENPALLKWFEIFCKNTNHKGLWERLQEEMSSWNRDPDTVLVTSPEGVKTTVGDLLSSWKFNSEGSKLRLGKLSLKTEAAGKVRVFAIVDAWTQSLLSPLHRSLFDILRQIPQDGTFDQLKPVKILMDKGLMEMYSFDLSAATDRLPIDLQVDILSSLFQNSDTAQAWKGLLVDRDYHLDSKEFPDQNGVYRYAVGQPMGALSSWAMLALTHHLIVQIAALRTGVTTWFEDYAILGDDIVIANKTVSQAYLVIMKQLGVDINLSKSVVSSIGGCEFAKKLIVAGKDYSPLGTRELFQFISSPRHFKNLVLNNKILELNLSIVDTTSASQFLTDLAVDSRFNPVWLSKVRSTFWDLLGIFGLNLTKDLSPSINTLAIDSLTSEESELFRKILISSLKKQIAQGWFKAFEKDVNMYSKIRRSFSFDWYCSSFPSTDHLLSLYSEDMMRHLSSPYFDLDRYTLEELLTLAFSDLGYISDPFLKTTKIKRDVRSKSLELSKLLISNLYDECPHLVIKLMRASQAFSRSE